jgi:hypothetical protein
MPETTRPNQTIEIVKRAVPRVLPCKLTDEDMLRISRTRVAREAERDQLVADAELDAKKRKAQIKEYDDEINVMRRELHSGQQDRTIKTNEVFEKDDLGNCWIVVYRLDSGEPTGERWPPSPAEMQRYLPALETGGILEQATKAQRSAQAETPDAEAPTDLPAGDDDLPNEDEGDDEPKKSGKRGKAK